MKDQPVIDERVLLKTHLAKLRYYLTNPTETSGTNIEAEIVAVAELLGAADNLSAMTPVPAMYYLFTLVLDRMVDVDDTRITTNPQRGQFS